MTAIFGEETTTDDLLEGVDLSGKTALVTGTSSGLGVETARALAARGARVIGAARDLEKAKAATASVRRDAANGGGFDLVELDLSSLSSVRECTQRLLDRGGHLDLIVANAGTMACPRGTTVDGFETQFGTNHLGHFLLINRLMPLLHQGSRVVILSSMAHSTGDIDLDDPNFESRPYDPWVAYGSSKTANALCAVEFDRRHRSEGIRAAAVHPGAIQTELGRHMSAEVKEQRVAELTRQMAETGLAEFRFKTVPQGAATTIWAGIVAPADMIGGRYCEDCHVADINPRRNSRGGVQDYAVDPERAKALWAVSEALVGETF